jgi:hypothetical protein
MELNRAILVLALAGMITLSALPCSAAEKEKEDIWVEDKPGEPRPGPRPGPGRGPRRFELTDEEIDRIMKELKESNPAKAKELAELREKDPESFKEELRRHGRGEEYGKIIRERIEKWRRERQDQFIIWLGKAVPKEARELAKLKERNPDLYAGKFELVWKKYERIFEEARRNPELADVLLEDLKLQERREELLRKIKLAKSEKEKKKVAADLEEVVAARFDLIVRRKQITYERLFKWLEELHKKVRASRDELEIWTDEKFKEENVKKRKQDLLEATPQFRWD